MTTNIGTIDRAARVILGVIIVTLTALGKISPWGWLGVMLIITATIKFCPAYSLFRFKTCKK